MDNLHTIQMQILRELIFHPKAKFSELNISNLTSDHFSYHINVLIEQGLVNKVNGRYALTNAGKIFTAKMDTEKFANEKQPKVSVLIIVTKKIGKKMLYAIQQRLKEPYYGYYGFMTGKIKWGERVNEAASRELKEEMGLAGEIRPLLILHEMVYDKQGNMLEDKYFHIVNAIITQDTLKMDEEGCHNEWFTREELMQIQPKYHNELEIFNWFETKKTGFVEETYFIESF